jgi:small subunit ribosomal protein S9
MAKIEDTIDNEETAPESYSTETPSTGSFSTETPAEAAPKAPRAVMNVPGAAVGRRKQAIARVRLIPGGGTITVNGRELAEYFPNKLHQQLINPRDSATESRPPRAPRGAG